MTTRKPRVISDVSAIAHTNDDFLIDDELQELEDMSVNAEIMKESYFGWGKVFISALITLFVLGFGLWVHNLISSLFLQYSILGWFALVVTILGLIALFIFVLNEIRALMRLSSVDHLRVSANSALATDNIEIARHAVTKLIDFTKDAPYSHKGIQNMIQHKDDIIDGRALIHLAEHHILRPADLQARRLILNSAKRVSIVTAVSPRAIVDLGYVLYESARLIRKLATLYGCRPAKFGLFTMARRIAAHLAVTGSIAVGDGLLQQIIGHGLAARISARLGEGVVNGLMTTRIGIAAMDALRPFPFDGEKRPGISDFSADLIGFNQPTDTHHKSHKNTEQ